MIPYGRQCIEDDDIQAVVDVLKSDWITTGPKIEEFESLFAQRVGARYAVAVSSGTAALHAAMFALGIGPGDEVICPAMTFAATANCIVFQSGTPVFADVEPDTLLIDPNRAEGKISPRTKAVIGVDYAGQPCDWDALRTVADRHSLRLVADGCHALGALYKGRPVGSLADLTVFSFHPVKHITTGEGGMITTDDPDLAARMRIFRNHGITTDHRERDAQGSWYYEMVELGWNYRLTDFQCALGISQLKKLPHWLERRQAVARRYDAAFSALDGVSPLKKKADIVHAYHLYVVSLEEEQIHKGRGEIFARLRSAGIGVNVHYIPVHLHPFYRRCFHTESGLCPVAEEAYVRILSLPMHAGLRDEEVEAVVRALREAVL